MDSHFFAYIYRLRYIERWSLMRNVRKENVAEHSYHTAILTHALCTIANEVFGKNIETEKAVTMALFHDVTEVFTGDIPTPVKHNNSDILNSFREIERTAGDRLLRMVPSKLQHVYQPLVGSKHAEHKYRAYIKGADLLDAYLKCTSELSAGNREFAVAQQQILNSIEKLGVPEVDYFLKHFAPSFEKTLDEISGEE